MTNHPNRSKRAQLEESNRDLLAALKRAEFCLEKIAEGDPGAFENSRTIAEKSRLVIARAEGKE